MEIEPYASTACVAFARSSSRRAMSVGSRGLLLSSSGTLPQAVSMAAPSSSRVMDVWMGVGRRSVVIVGVELFEELKESGVVGIQSQAATQRFARLVASAEGEENFAEMFVQHGAGT